MLTKDLVQSLRPGQSVADRGEARGLRVWNKDGTRHFLFRYRNRATGKLSTVFIGEFDPRGDGWTIAKARARTRELRAQLDAGDDPRQVREAQREARVQEAADAYAIRQLSADFLAYIGERVRPRTLADYKRELELLADEHGGRAAKDWTQPDVALWLDQRERIGHRAAGHALAAGRAAWNWATERGKVPLSPWRVPKARRKALQSGTRTRVLSDAELAKLIARPDKMPERTHEACMLMLLSGVRPGEACGAKWADVDLKAATWKLAATDTKGKRERTVYLSAPLVARLTALRKSLGRGRHRYLFPAAERKGGHLTGDYLAKSVGSSDVKWCPHDLRRTVTTRLQALGCPDEVGKRILGHAQEAGAFGHYAHHAYEKEQRDWLAKLAAELLP